MSKVLYTPQEMIEWRSSLESFAARPKDTGASLGFVPTMGALHRGHESLLQRARNENDFVVLSIFVNPTQFNDKTDLEKYPRTWERDLEMAKANKVDAVFHPSYGLMYPDDFKFKVIETDFSHLLCGKDRPGHFDGVLTVVMKLLNLVQPNRAYFGEKDFQQLTLIQNMVKAFFMPCEIISVPTVREADGLAMSSRNVRLKPEDREQAPDIHRIIKTASSAEEAKAALEKKNWTVDYVTDIRGRRFVAVNVGSARLIDNVEI